MLNVQAIGMSLPIHPSLRVFISPFSECVTVGVRQRNRLSSACLSEPADVNSSNALSLGVAAPLGTYTATAELDHWGYAISGSSTCLVGS